jgi:DNA-binding NarL/FixJ family response regulator
MADILIVDDHPIVAEGLQKLILSKGITKNCVAVYSFQECLRTLEIFKPDMILLDYNLPDGNGIDLCKLIKQTNENIKILAISSFREQSIVKLMIDSGASGYVLKNASEEEILEAIHDVLAGKKFMCDESKEIIDAKNTNAIVSQREIEVLRLIADGLTNTEIAEKLFLSPLTVDRHRKNLIVKFNAKNTASLIKIGMQKGYI